MNRYLFVFWDATKGIQVRGAKLEGSIKPIQQRFEDLLPIWLEKDYDIALCITELLFVIAVEGDAKSIPLSMEI